MTYETAVTLARALGWGTLAIVAFAVVAAIYGAFTGGCEPC